MHIWTTIQVVAILGLGAVKFTKGSLTFPLLLLLLVPFRLKLMPYMFTEKEITHVSFYSTFSAN